MNVVTIDHFIDNGETSIIYGEHSHKAVSFLRNLMPNSHQPIWREKIFRLATIALKLDPALYYVLGFDISCPGMRKSCFGTIMDGKTLKMEPWVSFMPEYGDD